MIQTLHPDQVWDASRTCFFVGLKADGKPGPKGQVYTDACGRRFVIVPRNS